MDLEVFSRGTLDEPRVMALDGPLLESPMLPTNADRKPRQLAGFCALGLSSK